MSLADSLKKIAAGAAEKGKDLAEQSKKAMDSAAEKAKNLAEQGKLASENQKQAQVISAAQAQIGAYVAENNLLADDEFVLGQMSVIAAAQEVQEKNNARIAELKAAAEKKEEKAEEIVQEKVAECCGEAEEVHVCEPRFCTKCGAQVRTDAEFCQACGAKL
jgi:hypothetical protein